MTSLNTFRNALEAFDTNTFSPFAVGFDRTFDRLWDYASHQTETTKGFPHYNIIEKGGHQYTIEMALAGYSKSDIDVEMADGVLTIKSIKTIENDDNKVYRGIASRNFSRKFTLADDIVVKDGSLKDGMLSIELERIVPEEKKPRLIKIK
jgi:molecular chaperone IbpA